MLSSHYTAVLSTEQHQQSSHLVSVLIPHPEEIRRVCTNPMRSVVWGCAKHFSELCEALIIRQSELFYCFSYPFYYLRAFLSHFSSLDVTQIRRHEAGSFPPSPLSRYGTRLHFFRGKINIPALPSSTRTALCLPTLLGALST